MTASSKRRSDMACSARDRSFPAEIRGFSVPLAVAVAVALTKHDEWWSVDARNRIDAVANRRTIVLLIIVLW